jgi:hypothetical protein
MNAATGWRWRSSARVLAAFNAGAGMFADTAWSQVLRRLRVGDLLEASTSVAEKPDRDDGVSGEQGLEGSRHRRPLRPKRCPAEGEEYEDESGGFQVTTASTSSPRRTPTIVETPGSCMVTP